MDGGGEGWCGGGGGGGKHAVYLSIMSDVDVWAVCLVCCLCLQTQLVSY